MAYLVQDAPSYQLHKLSDMIEPSRFGANLTDQGYDKYGILNVIPPSNYIFRKSGYTTFEENKRINFVKIRKEAVPDKPYISKNVKIGSGTCTLKEYRERHSKTSISQDEYWGTNNLISEYVEGWEESYHDPGSYWNPERCNGTLNVLPPRLQFPGIFTSYTYVGSRGAPFSFHQENLNLCTFANLGYGSKKIWYGAPGKYGEAIHRLAAAELPEEAARCPAFLSHKEYEFQPDFLIQKAIPIYRVAQKENTFMFTFPAAFHQGHNESWNIGESTNFGTDSWVPFYRWGTRCADTCPYNQKPHNVHISDYVFATQFLKYAEPNLYEAGKATKWANLRVDPNPFLLARDINREIFCIRCLKQFNQLNTYRMDQKNHDYAGCKWCGKSDYSHHARHARSCKKKPKKNSMDNPQPGCSKNL